MNLDEFVSSVNDLIKRFSEVNKENTEVIRKQQLEIKRLKLVTREHHKLIQMLIRHLEVYEKKPVTLINRREKSDLE